MYSTCEKVSPTDVCVSGAVSQTNLNSASILSNSWLLTVSPTARRVSSVPNGSSVHVSRCPQLTWTPLLSCRTPDCWQTVFPTDLDVSRCPQLTWTPPLFCQTSGCWQRVHCPVSTADLKVSRCPQLTWTPPLSCRTPGCWPALSSCPGRSRVIHLPLHHYCCSPFFTKKVNKLLYVQ